MVMAHFAVYFVVGFVVVDQRHREMKGAWIAVIADGSVYCRIVSDLYAHPITLSLLFITIFFCSLDVCPFSFVYYE